MVKNSGGNKAKGFARKNQVKGFHTLRVSEDPAEILAAMVGVLNVVQPSQIISDRASAIAYAVSIAGSGDTVTILGKGHELGQEIKGQIFDFDDRLVLAQAIEAKR